MKTDKDIPRYNGVILLDQPVEIDDGPPNGITTIYGILIDKDTTHKNDLWIWTLNSYICYMRGSQMCQEQGGDIFPDHWITKDGKRIDLTTDVRGYIYKIYKDTYGVPTYRIVESEKDFMIFPMEHDGSFLTSHSFIKRYDLDTKIKVSYKI